MNDIMFEQVRKTYGKHQALAGFDAVFKQGQVTALLGPSGAGKTTAVSILLGLLKPSSGAVRIGGHAPGHPELRERIGAMLQETPAPDGLTVRETVQLFRSYYRKPLPLERLLQAAGLEKEAGKRVASLSGGQKRRLAFALAMAGDPDIIVLDEPTTGMDVESRIRFWDIVKALAAQNKTILLTTHYLEEADAVADQIAVIAEGRIIAEGTPTQLKSAMPMRKVAFKTAQAPDVEVLRAMPGVKEVCVNGHQVELVASDSDGLLAELFRIGMSITDIQVQSASLEEVFHQLIAVHKQEEKGAGDRG